MPTHSNNPMRYLGQSNQGMTSKDRTNPTMTRDGQCYLFDNSDVGRPEVDGVGNKPSPSSVSKRDVCGDEDWREFTENTTLHGLRYIWMNDSTCSRRFLWTCLTLFCSAVMMYQILDRLIYYSEWPVTVNVKINYNDTLEFPSVTICNQNAFRATVAASLGRYELISEMFENIRAFRLADLERYNATSLTFSDLYGQAGHTKEDLIVSCQWRGEKCGPDNFTQIFTDYGNCYSFNYFNTPTLHVDSPGSEDGLSLTLNVEQYEYMPGPHDAAGVKLLLHHHDQFPNVKELGLVLSAGTHSFVGMKLVAVKNLPRPHGQCSSPSLSHYRHYSVETCNVECQTHLMMKRCQCRLYYMPELDGTPVCTLEQYFKCYRPNTGFFRSEGKRVCSCPIPCHFSAFDTSVSYAAASPLVADRFLASTNRSVLKAKYDLARDVNHRLRPEKRQWLQRLTANLQSKLDQVQGIIKRRIEKKLIQQKDAVHNVYHEISQLHNETKYLFEYQHYIVTKDFTRARTAMDERTFSLVAMGMQEFLFQVDTIIRQLSDNSTRSEIAREVLYLDVVRMLNSKIDISQRAHQNYTQFKEALISGQPIFNYSFRGEPRVNSPFIVPVPLFHDAMNMSKSIRRRTKLFGENIMSIIDLLNELKDLANISYISGQVNESLLFDTGIQYLRICREYMQSRDQFLYEIPQKIHQVLENRESRLNELWLLYRLKQEDVLTQVTTLTENMGFMRRGVLGSIVTGIVMARNFLQVGSLSKKDVARQFMKEEVQETQASLKTFFNEVRTRGYDLFDAWIELQKAATAIWALILDDVNLQTYLKFKKMNHLLIEKSVKARQLADVYSSYRESLDLRDDIRHVDTDFVESLTAMTKEMSSFKASEEIDVDFLQENILRLNIFYRELSYEQITQQEAYDIFALLCDIGGSMGLFLGASVITIIEVLDLVAYTYGQRLMRTRR